MWGKYVKFHPFFRKWNATKKPNHRGRKVRKWQKKKKPKRGLIFHKIWVRSSVFHLNQRKEKKGGKKLQVKALVTNTCNLSSSFSSCSFRTVTSLITAKEERETYSKSADDKTLKTTLVTNEKGRALYIKKYKLLLLGGSHINFFCEWYTLSRRK